MNTSDPKLAAPDAATAVPPGVPDLEQMVAWANELFRAPPGDPLAVGPTIAPQLPADYPAIPAPIPGMSLPEVPRLQSAGIPWESATGGVHGNPLLAATRASAFYFLDDARDPMAAINVLNVASELPGPGVSEPEPSAPAQAAPAKPVPALGAPAFDPVAVRRDFPILEERVNGRKLVWLDNAATTQKPQVVIDRLAYFYAHESSNVHRGAHTLAARSSDAYEAARETVRRFLHAPSTENIVFVRGATEGINLVAQSWGRRHVRAGDELIISWLEHHSNIVPWQQLCSETGARLRVAPIDDSGQIVIDEYERLFSPRTRLVSVTQVSNALGTVTPVRELTEIAHRHGALVLIDGAQAVSHMAVDVQALDCDFYVFSGHKVFAPTGIGALYGKSELLSAMPPWQGGGNMIADVTFEKTVYQPAPARFEAGTGNIADAVGLGAALDYLERIGLENVARYEHDLLEYGARRLAEVPRLRPIGTAREKAGVLSFVLEDRPSEQVGSALAREGIAVRAGHHCAQPALRRFGLESTVRPSLALYNTREDIDALVRVLLELQSGW